MNCFNNMANVAGATDCVDNGGCSSLFSSVICLIIVLIVFQFLTQIFNNDGCCNNNACGC